MRGRRYRGSILSTASVDLPYSGLWSEQQRFVQIGQETWPRVPLYNFTNATFTSGGISGRTGPDLASARTGLTGTGTDAWKTNTAYFNTSSGIQLWTVPVDGTYQIEIWGAQGGGYSSGGGFGARMRGDFVLTGGQVIKILVGQTGGPAYGGGGGMTAVATNTNTPLIVAGGGNTTSPYSSVLSHAVTTTSGVASTDGTAGGTNGSGGVGGGALAGGAGFIGNGGTSTCAYQTAPLSFINGGTGGLAGSGGTNTIGGFGGGAATDFNCQGASGGGGGYSGGGGGSSSSFTGGAGGSYNIGTNQSNSNGNTGTATLTGNGKVIITKL